MLCAADLKADFRSDVYSAYINNKMELWKNVIDRMEAINGKSNEQILELVNYQYGYIGYCLGFNKKEEAKRYFDIASGNIEFLEKAGYSPSMINAYRAAFYGFRISFNKFSAPVNGIKSRDHAKLALELDKENYFSNFQYGNALFYMPAAFGGSKKEALNYFLKARRILENNPAEIKENWNYMSLLIVVGQTYYYLDDYESAKAVYEEILRLEPGFRYVKDVLYPGLLIKMNG
jgi:tetratricopeptide (TPR) repeat protein